MRRRLEDVSVALSAGTLFYLREWVSLLPAYNADDYFLPDPHIAVLGAIVIAVMIVAAVGLSFMWSLEYLGVGSARYFALVPILAVPVLWLRYVSSFSVAFPLLSAKGLMGHPLWAASFLVLGLALTVLWVRHRSALGIGLRRALLAIFPLLPLLLLQIGWRALSASRQVPPEPVAAGALSGSGVLWIIFDELGERVGFDDRPEWLALPELDRFRGESIVSTEAFPPGSSTHFSLPSLILGKQVLSVCPEPPDDLWLSIDGATGPVSWRRSRTLFTEARDLGVRTGVAGWFHPYCRTLGHDLDWCSSVGSKRVPFDTSVFGNLTRMLHRAFTLPSSEERVHRNRVVMLQLAAERMIGDGSLGLALVHHPLPHLPGVGRVPSRASGEAFEEGAYYGNLRLVDAALGDLRRILEKNGTWDKTAVLVSSDHGIHDWRESISQSRRVASFRDKRVPFMLKLPGQKEGTRYTHPLNTVLTAPMILAILRGEIGSVQDATAWLDTHAPITALLVPSKHELSCEFLHDSLARRQ